MNVDVKVPAMGESVTEAEVGLWMKKVGESVKVDEPLVELETDKVTLEVVSPASGILSNIVAQEGDVVAIGQLLAYVSESDEAVHKEATSSSGAAVGAQDFSAFAKDQTVQSPAVAKMLAENSQLDPEAITGSGKDGRLTKGDILNAFENFTPDSTSVTVPEASFETATPSSFVLPGNSSHEHPREERVRMSRLRQTIAKRLKEAQNTAAMLTTFNEVDMSTIMGLRKELQEDFLKSHGVKLGFMSFFAKACAQALVKFPAINAEIDGSDIVYKNYFNIGVAVGTEQGLVVPVLRDVDRLSFAAVEKKIADFGEKARNGNLSIADMQGGTFTISNGGVYGSLNSTPILNSPQSAILGMHKTQDRPVAINGQVVIRPMMYLALSYDHRIIDGREAVTFLVKVKESLENPSRILFEL